MLKIPVIASDLPTGVTDVTNDATGILVPPGDAVALARAMEKLRDDRALAAKLGDAGRKRALARFTLRTFEKRIAEFGLKFGLGKVPRPPHWGGYRLDADAVELWVEGEFRIHDRARWTRSLPQQRGAVPSSPWSVTRLQP